MKARLVRCGVLVSQAFEPPLEKEWDSPATCCSEHLCQTLGCAVWNFWVSQYTSTLVAMLWKPGLTRHISIAVSLNGLSTFLMSARRSKHKFTPTRVCLAGYHFGLVEWETRAFHPLSLLHAFLLEVVLKSQEKKRRSSW